MNIHEVANEISWLDVKEVLSSWSIDCADSMYGAFLYLKLNVPNPLGNELILLTSEYRKEFPDKKLSKIQEYDVAFKWNNKDRYLDFLSWKAIASMNVDNSIFNQVSKEELVGLILYEMTFFAYSEEEMIQMERFSSNKNNVVHIH